MAEKQDVVFRGTKEGLYLIFNDAQNFDILKEKLKEHLKKAEYFFQGADVILDTGKRTLSLDEILEVQNILAYPYGLRLKKIVHGDELLRKPAGTSKETGISREPGTVKGPKHLEGAGSATSSGQTRTILPGNGRRGLLPGPGWPETLLYKGTLRSGQRITYDGNVVILGDVNPGAEIEATGDIVVMGSLRGLAHAGVGGATDVVVVAFRLQPTQLRIGDVIGRPPEGDPGLGKEPEVARLKDGMILVEPLDGSRWEGER
ncbi:MAG TPA: septum site-determining protein MinC [Firmicutes bacterium]|nr:septum site-determining protein MinC [Candidatus Fermentithermobacillaceae bacterium]